MAEDDISEVPKDGENFLKELYDALKENPPATGPSHEQQVGEKARSLFNILPGKFLSDLVTFLNITPEDLWEETWPEFMKEAENLGVIINGHLGWGLTDIGREISFIIQNELSIKD